MSEKNNYGLYVDLIQNLPEPEKTNYTKLVLDAKLNNKKQAEARRAGYIFVGVLSIILLGLFAVVLWAGATNILDWNLPFYKGLVFSLVSVFAVWLVVVLAIFWFGQIRVADGVKQLTEINPEIKKLLNQAKELEDSAQAFRKQAKELK